MQFSVNGATMAVANRYLSKMCTAVRVYVQVLAVQGFKALGVVVRTEAIRRSRFWNVWVFCVLFVHYYPGRSEASGDTIFPILVIQ